MEIPGRLGPQGRSPDRSMRRDVSNFDDEQFLMRVNGYNDLAIFAKRNAGQHGHHARDRQFAVWLVWLVWLASAAARGCGSLLLLISPAI